MSSGIMLEDCAYRGHTLLCLVVLKIFPYEVFQSCTVELVFSEQPPLLSTLCDILPSCQCIDTLMINLYLLLGLKPEMAISTAFDQAHSFLSSQKPERKWQGKPITFAYMNEALFKPKATTCKDSCIKFSC
jgi:hypothetical protein